MKTLTIGKRIWMLVAAMITLMCVIGGVALNGLHQLEDTLTFMEKDPIPGAKSAGRIARLNAEVVTAMFHAVAASAAEEPEEKRQLEEKVQQFKKELAAYDVTITAAEDRAMFVALNRHFERFSQAYAEAMRAKKPGIDIVLLTDKYIEGPGKEVTAQIEKIVDFNESNGAKAATEGRKAASSAGMLLWGLQFTCIVLAIVGSLWLVRSVNAALAVLLEQLEQGAAQVAAASNQLASTSQSLSQGSSQQAASLEEISASMEEMTAMTRRNSENATSASGMMAETAQQVERSNVALTDMVASMDAIKVSSEKIGRINKTIDEIAFQTNILALNAAVEAARAGEAGMGFAVVADEVRNLAQRSAVAAKDTAQLIEEAIANSNRGASKLEGVAGVIRAITESSSKVRNLVEEVNEASRQQTQGINQVSSAISQVSRVTQTAAASSEESAAASEELSSQAMTVRDLLGLIRGLAGIESKDRYSSGGSSYAINSSAPSRPVAARKASGSSASSSQATSRAAVEDEFPMDDDGGSFRSF